MTTARACGDCQLCCRLLPTEEIGKPALERCPHQKHGVGCAIYAKRPMSCSLWSCRWLMNDDTADLPRPDRAHYVIDMIPDFVTATPNEPGGEPENVGVIQVWGDPTYPDAHRAPSFRRWLDRQGVPALIRFGSNEGFLLCPPSTTGGAGWVEHHAMTGGREHTLAEKAAALGGEVSFDFEIDGVQQATLTIEGKTVRVGARVENVATAEEARDSRRPVWSVVKLGQAEDRSLKRRAATPENKPKAKGRNTGNPVTHHACLPWQ